MLTDIFMLILVPLLLIASGFFSGTETALFSLTGHQRVGFERSHSVAGRTITTLLSETRHLLITLLLGNMTVNVLYLAVTTMLLIRLSKVHEASPWLVTAASIVPVTLLILFGEILPKLLASRTAEIWSRVASLPMFVVHRAISPIRRPLNAIVITPLARLIAPRSKPPELSAEELERLLTLSEHHGIIDAEEEDVLRGVLQLSQLRVRDIMTPRVDVVAFDIGHPVGELIDTMGRTRLSHVPVVDGEMDHLVGVVHARDVMLRRPDDLEALRPLIREAYYIPELARVDDLLRQLRKAGTTFAIVIDEFGGTAGLATLEDAVEEMVGDITGPYEPGGDGMLKQVGENLWRVSAQLPIHDWLSVFGQSLAPSSLSTAGGLVMARLGRLPRVGDRIHVGNLEIEVERMDGRRVAWLLMRVEAPAGELVGAEGGTP